MSDWTYSIAYGTLPDDIAPADFFACIRKAIARVCRASGGKVSFALRNEFGERHVTFGFAKLDGINQVGSRMMVKRPDGVVIETIAFDPGYRWAVTGLQRLFIGATGRQNLLAVAMHELGHALGLPHSDDEFSAMHSPAKVAEFNERDKMYLRYL